MSVFSSNKAVSSELDWAFNWAGADDVNDGSAADTGFLQGETIATSEWDVYNPAGTTEVTILYSNNDDTRSSVALAGGQEGMIYRIKNTITDTRGMKDTRTMYLEIIND